MKKNEKINENRKKYLAKNTFLFALGNFGTKIVIFFLLPLYTNVLSTAEYGQVDLISTIGMVIAPIVILNISEALLRFPLDDDADNIAIMSTGILGLLLGIIISLIVFPIFNNFNWKNINPIFLYFYIISYAAFQVFTSYLRGKEKLLQYSVTNILNSLLVAIFNIIFLLGFKRGVDGYLAAYILAFTISAIYAFVVGNVKDVIKNFKINKKLTTEMLKYSVVLIPNTFLWWITNSSDRIMVSHFVGDAQNGIYAISYKIPTLLSTVALIFNQAYSYSAIKEEKSTDKVEMNNRIFQSLAGILTVTGAIMMVIMKPFLKIYVNDTFYTAWKYTPYLIIGFVFSSLGSFLGTQYTVYKDSKGYLFSALIGALTNIGLNALLIPLIGVYGAATATLISYLVVFMYRLLDTKKYLKIEFLNKKNIIGYILLFMIGISMYIETILGIVISIVSLILSILLYRDTIYSIVKDLIKMIKNKICLIRNEQR